MLHLLRKQRVSQLRNGRHASVDAYELSVRDIGRMYFMPDDLYYFHEHFVCKSMADGWSAPRFTVVRKRTRPADFSSWMLNAPVVRENVRIILEPFLGCCVEFLDFYTTDRGERLYAMNVLTTDQSVPLFKTHRNSVVYARHEFGIIARDNKFTGLALADPNANNLKMIVHRQNINVFPGL